MLIPKVSVSTMFFDQNHVDNVDSLGDLVCGRSAQRTMEFPWSFHSPVLLPGGSGYHDGSDGHVDFHYDLSYIIMMVKMISRYWQFFLQKLRCSSRRFKLLKSVI